MKKCVFLSTDKLEDFFVYDMLVAPHLERLGWHVSELSWHDTQQDWNQYDVVIVRSTWDYQQHEKAFLECLQRIEDSSCALENQLALMQWNISKTYLRDLHNKGVPIIPTIWCDELCHNDLNPDVFETLNASEIVIKPYVSANSDFTYRLNRDQLNAQKSRIVSEYKNKSAMVQPFLNSIVEEGEYSLFYFDGRFSHAISKHPKVGDFRVQEEHGGHLKLIQPSQKQLSLAEQTLALLPHPAFFARVDIVMTPKGLAIIEIELIEPSLYFNMDEQSALRFANAIHQKYGL